MQKRIAHRVDLAEMLPRVEAHGQDRPGPRQILKKLDEPISMSFANETPLEDVLKYIKSATAGPERLGHPDLRRSGRA